MKRFLLFYGFLLGSLSLSFAQPSNDDCANAVTLVCGAGLTAGTTVDAVAPDNPTGCASDYGVWYTFVGDGSIVTVNSPTTFDHELDIFTASAGCGSTYTTVICRDVSLGTETYTFTSVSGTIYYVYVAYFSTAGTSTQTGTFDIEITCAAPPMPPVNDDCANAIALTVNPDLACGSVTSGTISGATPSGDDESACGGTEDDDVWFSFTASATSHDIELLNLANGTTDLYHSVWEGSCGGLTLLAGSCSDPNTSSPTGFTVGNTYYIRVYSWTATTNQTTTFDVCVGTPPPPPMPPVNDDCANATALTVNPDLSCGSVTSGTILGATASGDDETACGGTEDDDVWFSFVATSTSHNIDLLNAAGSTTDLYHSLWSGPCSSLVNLLCSDPNSSVASGLTIGDTYYLRVYSWTSTSGQTTTFDVCISTESCVIPVATVAVDPSGCPNGPSVTVDITDFGSATSIDITDDQGSSSLTVNAVGTYSYGGYPDGTTVVITLTFSDANGGNTDCDLQSSAITLTCPPSNDDCVNAIAIPVGEMICDGTTTNGDNTSATAGTDPVGSCFNGGSNGVWFSFVAPASGDVSVSTDFSGGTNDDTEIAVYDDCAGTNELGCSQDEGVVVSGFGSYLSIIPSISGLTPGDTYFILVSGYSGTEGTFCLAIDEADVVVPVELHSLKGKAHEKHNTISWSTTSEVNNDYQMLQTSYDGYSNWVEVDRVRATNSNELSNYSIQDDRPRMESYYRVKSVDFDGYTAYSTTIMVDRSRYGVKGVTALISPNPFNDRFEITLASDVERKVSLTLLDIQGRVIINNTMNLVNGINKNTMSMEQYETGFYLLRIATDDYEEVIKLVKN